MKTSHLLLVLLAHAPLALAAPTPPNAPSAVETQPDATLTIDVTVHGGAYSPAVIKVKEGQPFRLRFLKTDHDGCTRDVVLGWLGLRRTLPTGEPITIDVPPLSAGTWVFTCGMNMVKGTILVTAHAPGGSHDAH